jgi:23S rRNA-/tRNA-specific pseudouridylate synthase
VTAPRVTSPEATETVTLSASAEDAGQRLDAFLAAHIDGWSRSRLQRVIDDGDVLVNCRSRLSFRKTFPSKSFSKTTI